jgi:hypothetical protein
MRKGADEVDKADDGSEALPEEPAGGLADVGRLATAT